MISEEIRKLVISKLKKNISKVEISKSLNISLKSVYNIDNGKEVFKLNNRAKESRLVSQNVKRAAEALVRQNRRITSSSISKKISIKRSQRTLRRHLSTLDYKYIRNTQKIVLTEKQKEIRVKIVKAWICEKCEMDLVIFTDESRFTLDGNDNFYTWCSEKTGTRKKRPFKGGSIMVWGCISKEGIFEIRKIDKTMNMYIYCELLQNDILPILKQSNSRFIFQQDNATPHVSKMSIGMFRENNVTLLEWPPHSPDLSPIEYIWSILKSRVYNGPQFQDKENLWNRIKDEVENIKKNEKELFIKLYKKLYENMTEILLRHGDLVNK